MENNHHAKIDPEAETNRDTDSDSYMSDSGGTGGGGGSGDGHAKKRSKKRLFARIGAASIAALSLWLLLGGQEAQAGFVGDLFDSMLQALKDWIEWLLCWIIDLVWPLAETVITAIPEDWMENATGAVSVAVDLVKIANAWVALDVAFTLLLAWLVFVLIVIAVKLAVKLFVPTVG